MSYDDAIDLKDKVVLITGANTGIGYETALALAKRGAILTLACRDQNKAKVACDKIISETKNKNVFFERLDLADLNSIRSFAQQFLSKSKRLDILINNAGLITDERQTTKDGFEMHFGVNHLGHFLLTNLLLDLIIKSAPSRIINVSSMVYKNSRINWDDLQYEKGGFASFKVYGQSKLANILFTIELAKRLRRTGVTTVAVHPGFVNTEAARDFKGCFGCVMRCLNACAAKTPRDGAETTVYCAISKHIEDYSGQYFSDCRPEHLSKQNTSDEDANKLWNISAELVNLTTH